MHPARQHIHVSVRNVSDLRPSIPTRVLQPMALPCSVPMHIGTYRSGIGRAFSPEPASIPILHGHPAANRANEHRRHFFQRRVDRWWVGRRGGTLPVRCLSRIRLLNISKATTMNAAPTTERVTDASFPSGSVLLGCRMQRRPNAKNTTIPAVNVGTPIRIEVPPIRIWAKLFLMELSSCSDRSSDSGSVIMPQLNYHGSGRSIQTYPFSTFLPITSFWIPLALERGPVGLFMCS